MGTGGGAAKHHSQVGRGRCKITCYFGESKRGVDEVNFLFRNSAWFFSCTFSNLYVRKNSNFQKERVRSRFDYILYATEKKSSSAGVNLDAYCIIRKESPNKVDFVVWFSFFAANFFKNFKSVKIQFEVNPRAVPWQTRLCLNCWGICSES